MADRGLTTTAKSWCDNTPGSDYSESVSWECPHRKCNGRGSFELSSDRNLCGAVELRWFECVECERTYRVRFE